MAKQKKPRHFARALDRIIKAFDDAVAVSSEFTTASPKLPPRLYPGCRVGVADEVPEVPCETVRWAHVAADIQLLCAITRRITATLHQDARSCE